MVTVQVYADSKPLTIPVSTPYKSFRNSRKWNEWLELPIKFSQLPLTSQLAITIWDYSGGKDLVCYGGTTVKLFQSTDCTIKTGRQKLKVWLDREADGHSNSTTDSTIVSEQEMDRLEKLIKKHEAGDLPMVDWLDNLTFRKIEQINKNQRPNNEHENILYVDLVQFDFPVVFSDIEYSVYGNGLHGYVNQRRAINSTPASAGLNSDLNNEQAAIHPSNAKQLSGATTPIPAPLPVKKAESAKSLIIVNDPEQNRENPIESKYRRLVRNHKSNQFDQELKPNAKIRDELNVIINSPVQELTVDEKNLLWKFRYYLTRHKQALTKFLQAVSWEDAVEARQAVEMLPRWAEIGVDDALELLGPAFTDPNVRLHAVNRLRKANDQELELYLLQLVEALKFEYQPKEIINKPGTSSAHRNQAPVAQKAHLAGFLIGRAVKNPILGNYFYWYLAVEAQEKTETAETIFQPILNQFLLSLQSQPPAPGSDLPPTEILRAQIKLMRKLLDVARNIRQSKEARPKKVSKLRAYLAESKTGLVSFPPIALPLNPTVKVVGCIPEDSNVFKSSLSPIKVTLKAEDGSLYPIILKSGDDLRQDQLVIQIITLMDQLLRNENLDLKLTPYRILATATKEGALQFVPNETIAHVLAEYHGILPYLRNHNPDESNELKIKPEAMDTFVRSCAGYCVITYILGVGDRHLDNLLICPDGHFFHADYGYILGRDPKPFPPMMKLPYQLIEGMGGASSENYDKFRSYCFTAYTTLRKSANLILSLFALMTESSIPDIMFEREKAVQKVKEKFCLEMTEAEAMIHFQNLINASVNSLVPIMIDRLHSLAQYWRA
ncbi:phosphatidylinositol 3-kinase VPS34 [Sugiyamaella lignohabitans]|uniref:Phosphatidylinositol 3-kinase VPS34 n=1 Tax=Sugiyamaella lignohabitans TaxID=796027 RepID=A0A167CFY5_9ASCO|nr:phosphatidylinositol 3-kinase VPS34 [Sugiyamaella lignohabitans]ANB11639.1 phosphatidylinositol 3-kinase VPS34 [Sugiyamaella lignohabitans]